MMLFLGLYVPSQGLYVPSQGLYVPSQGYYALSGITCFVLINPYKGYTLSGILCPLRDYCPTSAKERIVLHQFYE